MSVVSAAIALQGGPVGNKDTLKAFLSDMRRLLDSRFSEEEWAIVRFAIVRRACVLIILVLVLGCGDKGRGARVAAGGSYVGGCPSFSPDEQSIVFGAPNSGGRGNICIVNVDGSGWKQLTSTPYYDGEPQFSPDGKSIVFISEREGSSGIFLMDASGGNPHRITKSENIEHSPSFSPNGKQIVFTRYMSNATDMKSQQIFIIDANGTNEKQLTHGDGPNVARSFSNDGRSIFFVSGLDSASLYKIDINGQNKTEFFSGHTKGESSISNDNKSVGYVDDSVVPYEYEVYVASVDNSAVTKITSLHSYIESARFSSTGSLLVFVSQTGSKNGKGDIYIVGADGTGLKKVTANTK
jgi:Tol biopolymer transport system component